MCWRDAYIPLTLEDIHWNMRWNSGTRVSVGDQFTFGPLFEDMPDRTAFYRILKPGQDNVGQTSPEFHNGTEVRFTHGPYHKKKAVIKMHWKRKFIRIQIKDGPCLYPFQPKRPYAEKLPRMKFTVTALPKAA